MSFTSRLSGLFGDSSFRGPVLKLLSGSGYAFIVAYLAKIVLLNLYSPADFGMFGFVIAVAGVIGPLASMRYEDALMLPANERRAAHIFVLAMIAVIALSCVSFSGVLFRHEIASLFGDAAVAGWIWAIPVVVLFNRSARVWEVWLSRQEAFGRIAMGQVVQSSTMTVVRIGAGVVRPAPAGLILGFVFGFAASLGFLFTRVWSTLRNSLQGSIDPALLRSLAARYRRFPLFTMPASMISAGMTHLPAVLLLFYFDTRVVGIYSQAFAVLFLPLSQVGAAVAQVFFVRASEALRSGSLVRVSARVHGRMVLLALFPTAVAMVAGADLFEFLFGPSWRPAGEYLVFLAPWIALTAIASPLTRLFDVLERQRLELLTTAVMAAVLVVALVVGGRSAGIERTLLYLGVGGVVVRTGQLALLLRLAHVSFRRALAPYVRYGAFSLLPVALIAYVATFGDLFATAATAFVVSVVFAVVLLRLEGLLNPRASHRVPRT